MGGPNPSNKSNANQSLINAFEIQTLIPKVEGGKIHTITSWEDKIYIGTDDGHIILYNVQEHENTGKFLFQMDKRVNLGFGKKLVDQLLVIRDIGKLVVRCDGNLAILNLFTLETAGSIQHKKGVGLIVSERASQSIRIAFEHKQKLFLFEYTGSFQFVKSIQLDGTPLILEWYNGTICVGYSDEYVLYDTETLEAIPMFKLEPTHKPMVRLIEQEFLLARDDLGIFVTDKGLPIRGHILWSCTPDSLEFRAPYVISMQLRNSWFEIHSILNQNLVQRIPFPDKKEFRVTDSYEGSKFLLVASSSVVYMIVSKALEGQVKSLLEQKKISDALDLLSEQFKKEKPEVAKRKTRGVLVDAAYSLFHSASFEGAFEGFQLAEVDPRDVIACFPSLIPSESSYKTKPSKTIQEIVQSAAQNSTGSHKIDADKLIVRAKILLLGFLSEVTSNTKDPNILKDSNTVSVRLLLDKSFNVDQLLADEKIEEILNEGNSLITLQN
eukprot:TRINITY_DN4553_c0_g1_i1.p1 TRINITY_DN4553_c0_g1~~TRINITY_DN4553_c0_g1_i1.p1  ORF type:complete len:496 (-),score=141.57 TRINITY_DN4553_c0_g1_i1:1164-2651(-)